MIEFKFPTPENPADKGRSLEKIVQEVLIEVEILKWVRDHSEIFSEDGITTVRITGDEVEPKPEPLFKVGDKVQIDDHPYWMDEGYAWTTENDEYLDNFVGKVAKVVPEPGDEFQNLPDHVFVHVEGRDSYYLHQNCLRKVEQ